MLLLSKDQVTDNGSSDKRFYYGIPRNYYRLTITRLDFIVRVSFYCDPYYKNYYKMNTF